MKPRMALIFIVMWAPVVWFSTASSRSNTLASQQKGQDSLSIDTLLKAAEQGDPKSQCKLAKAYLSGTGVQLNEIEAAKWYRKAAEQGYAEGQFQLGSMYHMGRGVRQDAKLAVRWYRKAAEQSYEAAQLSMGIMYVENTGIVPDYIQAYMWFDLPTSSTPNKEEAALWRNKISARMSSQQIAKAQRMAMEWKSKHLVEAAGTSDDETCEGTPPAGDGPYKIGCGVSAPIILSQPFPNYTEEARAANVQGSVVVQAIFRKNGTVDSFKILKGLGHGLDEAAIQTIATKWRFRPGTFKGESVDVQCDIVITFHRYDDDRRPK